MKQNWTYKKLGEVVTIIMGQSPSSDTYNESEGLPFFQGNADFGEVYPNVRIYCNAPIRIANNGDVLISVRAPIGAINIADRKCCIGRGLAAIRGNEKNQSRFIYYLLLASKEKLVAQGTGSTFKSIGKDTLYNLLIPFVSLETQSRIVSELDLLQSLIEKQQAQLKEYDSLAQSIFYHMFGDPVENEKGWERKPLKEIGKVITGNTPSTKDEENYSSNDYCFVKPSDIDKDTVSYITETEFYISSKAFGKSRQLPKGSVLTTCIGIIGKVGILEKKATCNQQINAIVPSDNVSSTYMAYSIVGIKRILESMANAPVVPIINKGDFSNVIIPVPPLFLQQSFAAKIEAIEKQKALVNQSITETQRLFDYTMDKYFG